MAKDDSIVADDVTTDTKARFSQAVEDAKSNAQALGKSVQDKSAEFKDKAATSAADLKEKAAAAAADLKGKWADKSVDLKEEAKAISADAKVRAAALANDGKARASDALSGLGKVVAENAGIVDDKLGEKYGDYARTAARHIQETAAKLESKDLDQLGSEAKEFVKKNPGVAVGLAAVAGFFVARLLKKSDD